MIPPKIDFNSSLRGPPIYRRTKQSLFWIRGLTNRHEIAFPDRSGSQRRVASIFTLRGIAGGRLDFLENKIPPDMSGYPLYKRGPYGVSSPLMGLVSKVVIPVKTGIQTDVIRYDFWIPICVGMAKRLKNSTYDIKPP